MFRHLLFLIATLCSPLLKAQTFPKEGAVLHYRIIAFNFPVVNGADNYRLEIFNGEPKKLKKKADVEATSPNTNITATVARFGSKYTWRYAAYSNGKKIFNSQNYHFTTGYSHLADNDQIRVTVQQPYEGDKIAYFFSDKSHALYNMAGEPVWFLPELPGVADSNAQIRDLKVTNNGTITFLNNTLAAEIDWEGHLLWRYPLNNNDSLKVPAKLHHEFTRLNNGNYMLLGAERIMENKPGEGKREMRSSPLKAPEGTILEVDTAGRIVWYWKSASYYTGDKQPARGQKRGLIDNHENAFYFDEKNGMIYVSFRNTNQILRLRYPEGDVTAVYGRPSTDTLSLLPFCSQHACKLTTGGHIALFNNNNCNTKAKPTIVFMNEANTDKLYEVTLPVGEPQTPGAGGNIAEISNNTFFVSACAPYPDLFVIGFDGHIYYHAQIEIYNKYQNKWEPASQYRANPVSNQTFDKLLHYNNSN